MDVWVYHEEVIDPPVRIDDQVARMDIEAPVAWIAEEKAVELAVLYPNAIYFFGELVV